MDINKGSIQAIFTAAFRCYLSTVILLLSAIYYCSSVEAADLHYAIDGRHADIRLLVYKRGALQLFGHNHVIRITGLTGEIMRDTEDIERSSISLTIPVHDLAVDRPEDRKRSGDAFANAVDNETSLATRKNMLGPQLLDARHYPQIHIQGRISTAHHATVSHITVSIKGRLQQYIVPVDIRLTDSVITARGRFTARQSDFGMQPMSLLGGLLAVRDDFDVLFNIQANAD